MREQVIWKGNVKSILIKNVVVLVPEIVPGFVVSRTARWVHVLTPARASAVGWLREETRVHAHDAFIDAMNKMELLKGVGDLPKLEEL